MYEPSSFGGSCRKLAAQLRHGFVPKCEDGVAQNSDDGSGVRVHGCGFWLKYLKGSFRMVFDSGWSRTIGLAQDGVG